MRNFLLAAALILAGLGSFDQARAQARSNQRIAEPAAPVTIKGRIYDAETGEVGVLNGTFINGARLSPGEPHPLRDGDEVGFGTVKMHFVG